MSVPVSPKKQVSINFKEKRRSETRDLLESTKKNCYMGYTVKSWRVGVQVEELMELGVRKGLARYSFA